MAWQTGLWRRQLLVGLTVRRGQPGNGAGVDVLELTLGHRGRLRVARRAVLALPWLSWDGGPARLWRLVDAGHPAGGDGRAP
jgi:hypothetical protein